MAFRSTEITIRETLLEELAQRGVKFGHEMSVQIPHGRRAPDAVLTGGGNYVLETKMGREAAHYQDILKLYEWLKLRHVPILGAFAVLMPDELRRLPWEPETTRSLAISPKMSWQVTALFRDDRPAAHSEGSLSKIADWIANQVLRAPVEIEPDTNFVIRVLSGAVSDLNTKMMNLGPEELEDIFGGRSVFDNILELKEGEYPVREMRSAASYLLINQLIFYSVLSRVDPVAFKTILSEELRNPADLSSYFRKVLEIDYAPTFGFDVASRLTSSALDSIRSVVDIIRVMGLDRIKQDVLGKIFHNLIPLNVRKAVAAYYTSNQAGELLSMLSIKSPDDKVIDFACGSGTLLTTSYQQKKRMLESQRGSFSEEDHTQFVSKDITGIDIMPFAAHLAVVHLSLQAPRFVTEQARIAVWDSTELRPGEVIPPISSELSAAFRRPTLEMFDNNEQPENPPRHILKGVLTAEGLGGERIDLSLVDVVIMNPPFTKRDRLTSEYREVIDNRFSAYSDMITGKFNYQGYFLLLADRFLKPGGRMGFVLPQTTFTSESFTALVEMLTRQYTISAIVVGLGRSAFSENTSLSEVLFVAEKNPAPDNHRFAIVGTKKSPSEWDHDYLLNLTQLIRKNMDYSDDMTLIRLVPQSSLSVAEGGLTKLLPLLQVGYEQLMVKINPVLHSKLMVSYSEYERRHSTKAFISELASRESPGPEGRGGVYFGTAGLNICRDATRALKNVDRMILTGEKRGNMKAKDRFSGQEFSIPSHSISPTVRRLLYYPMMDVTGKEDLVISEWFEGLDTVMNLIYGEVKAAKYVQRIHERWPKRIAQGSSQLCLAYRIDLGGPGTIHLSVFSNSLFFVGRGGWGFRNLSTEDAKLLCLWFNSSLFLIQMLEQRTQTRGTWVRLDKKRIARTNVPDFASLSHSQRERLLRTFDELSKLEFPSLLNQLKTSFTGRRAIDDAWLQVMDGSSVEKSHLIQDLHRYLYTTLSDLIQAMSKD